MSIFVQNRVLNATKKATPENALKIGIGCIEKPLKDFQTIIDNAKDENEIKAAKHIREEYKKEVKKSLKNLV